MQNQIRDVGHEIIPQQLMAWQREDMHRHFPNVDSEQEYVSWFTLIWPRSRTYDKSGQQYVGKGVRRRIRRPLSPRPRLIGGVGGRSTRPILRPALFERLQQRMSQMLSVNLAWVTSRSAGAQVPQPSGDFGPQTARRAAMNAPVSVTKVATVAKPGPRTLERWAKLGPPPTKVATVARPGPRALERLAKLGLTPPT